MGKARMVNKRWGKKEQKKGEKGGTVCGGEGPVTGGERRATRNAAWRARERKKAGRKA